jgi:hypothetical protein
MTTDIGHGDCVECDVNGDWDQPERGTVVAYGTNVVLVRGADGKTFSYWREEVRIAKEQS